MTKNWRCVKGAEPEQPRVGGIASGLAAAEDSVAAERHTPAAGDAIHAGISAKDAIVTALTGTTSKGKNHATAAGELKQALGLPGLVCSALPGPIARG
jgi:hypothetical protein